MSHDPAKLAKHLKSHGGPVHSEPHAGHEGTTYEGTDASVGIIVGSLAIIALTLAITAVVVLPIQNLLKHANPPGELPSPLAPGRVVPPAPVLEVHPWETFPDLRAHEDEILNSVGKDVAGHTHVPIEGAMDAVVSKLNVRANAPQGLTVPGGQGRDFAGSLSSLPPPYQPPTIRGEIRKNAQ
jgi:hypothetical protein